MFEDTSYHHKVVIIIILNLWKFCKHQSKDMFVLVKKIHKIIILKKQKHILSLKIKYIIKSNPIWFLSYIYSHTYSLDIL